MPSASLRGSAAVRLGSRRGWTHRQTVAGYIFVAPSLIFLLIFVVYPIFAALYFSFTKYELLQAPKFIGFDNFVNLIDDKRFFGAIWNTVLFAVMTVPIGTALSLFLAMAINQPLRGITVFRTAYYTPVVTSFVAVSFIWLWLYEPQFGILNTLFEAVGLPRLHWLRDPSTAMLSIAILSVWKNVGYNMVIYLAGLQGIPEHLYEAALVDGAGPIQRFRYITVPLLSPTTFFVFVVYFIGALQMFVQSWILTQGGPLDSTLTVVYLIYLNGFEYLKMGYAAAMSFLLFVIIAIVTYINTRIIRYDEYY
ncbi:MAG: sugar ABC transporter permease [Chloroflexota bacterium]|nr:MAG: sugar ABC transporter permease [Chloroflexota bacterium]